MAIADDLAIIRLLSMYARALDTLELGLLDDVFTADARLEMSKGRPMDRAAYKAMCEVELAKLDATQHIVTNFMVDVATDGRTATCRSYYQAQHARNDCEPPLALMGGWVDDELEQRGEGWRITARRWTSVWFDGNAAVLGGAMRRGAQRRRATRDLS
jgi:hypothetical protein